MNLQLKRASSIKLQDFAVMISSAWKHWHEVNEYVTDELQIEILLYFDYEEL